MLRNYCQQARRTTELAELLAAARDSTRNPGDRPLPRQNTLHRSVVKLLIEDYEAGASTYELAKRYNVRRNGDLTRLLEQEVEVLRRATAYLSQAHLPGK